MRKRRFPVLGKGDGVFSFIHVDDAAAATVAAVERGAPGIYNVVDDEPAPLRDWLPAYAEALGREAAATRAGVARAPGWPGSYTASMATDAARRVEREGQARARLGSRATRAGGRASERRSASYASAVSMAPTGSGMPAARAARAARTARP